MEDLKILVVEDEPLIARDIATTLQRNDFTDVSMCYSYNNAKQLINDKAYDLVILDINLGEGAEGIDLGKIINETKNIPFIYLSSYSDKATLNKAKLTEPFAYVVKPFLESGLIASIEIALYNYAQKNKQFQPKLNLDYINSKINSPITEREFEVLELIYEGNMNQQIADKIFVSLNTIKKHINNIYLKLETSSRSSVLVKLRKLMIN